MIKTTMTAKTTDSNCFKSTKHQFESLFIRYSRTVMKAWGFIFQSKYDIFGFWLLVTLFNAAFHRLIPLDETRYASVAWEMWERRDFIVPYLNGNLYHHKPPLLFWLFHLGWRLFGVNEIWLLWVSPLCGLAILYWVRYAARLLWPALPETHRHAPWMLFGSLTWVAFMNSVMFDMLLSVCELLAITGLILNSKELQWRYWVLYSLGCGLGLLAKGPVIFLFIVPLWLSGRFWNGTARSHPSRWYLQGSAALLAGIALALCWAVPALHRVGNEYGGILLWHQTVDRMVGSFAHRRAFWWYLEYLPIILFPWFFWPRVWKELFNRSWLNDASFRFCLIWLLSGFFGFSLISGKQIHYLLPIMPAFALMLGRTLSSQRYALRTGDFIPYILICLFGIALLLLPYWHGITIYHWIQNRKIEWSAAVILTGMTGLLVAINTRKIAAYHLSIAVILLIAVSLDGFFSSNAKAFNLQEASVELLKYRKINEPIAWAGKYDGEFQFLMHLDQPMPVIGSQNISNWLDSHKNGHVIMLSRELIGLSSRYKIDYSQPYREEWLLVLSRLV